MPIVMLSYSLIFSVCAYFDFYASWFIYLSDILGYSIFTNIFMISVYMNRKYCDKIKIAVFGLILLNICNLIYYHFGINGFIYDIYIIVVIFTILTFKR